jgi:1,4-alpha-glucan branching enzyme
VVKEKTKDMLVATQFILKAPSAQSVYVTGEFNNWYVDESCRMRQQDGQWTVQVKLKPGRYQYRYIVDGFWQEDPQNPMKIENAFGDANSVVEVKG